MGQIQEFINYIFQSLKIWVIIQPWELGLIVRNGKRIKEVSHGIFFKLPYFDSVYIQESRLRVIEMPMQTLTTKDLKTITLNSAIGYSINNIRKLYDTLYHPEQTLQNIAMSEMAEVVFKTNLDDITPQVIEESVMKKLDGDKYGLVFDYFRLTNFAVVKTFRLIQDQSWIREGLEMDNKIK